MKIRTNTMTRTGFTGALIQRGDPFFKKKKICGGRLKKNSVGKYFHPPTPPQNNQHAMTTLSSALNYNNRLESGGGARYKSSFTVCHW